jgi:hypothetical protein
MAALFRRLSILAALAVVTIPVRSAFADDEGGAGRVVRLTINTQGSDKYASFHGSVSVRKSGSTKNETYFWGGSTCPAQRLDPAEVALLASALENRAKTLVAPRYRTGEGARGARCLVAFELVAASP